MDKRNIIIIAALAVIIAAGGLYFMRGQIKTSVYRNETGKLIDVLPAELAEKYGEELDYTMDKFWSCYEDGIVSQNDMTDVMDRLRTLRSQREIKDLDVFEFIGYVSRCYTDAMNKRHQENEAEADEGPQIIQQ